MSNSASTMGLPVLRHSSSASAGRLARTFSAEAEEDAAAFLRGGRRPWAVFESGFGGGYGAVDVVGAGVGNLGDDFFGGGIVDGKSLRGLARDPLAVDVHLVGFDFGCDSAGHWFDLLLTSGAKAPKSISHLKRHD